MRASFAKFFNDPGNSARDRGSHRLACASYKVAAKMVPRWSSPWYNLGLQAKYLGDWRASLAYNQKAALLDPDDEASWWNLGIAATALRDWVEARRAWQMCGIELDEAPVKCECRVCPLVSG